MVKVYAIYDSKAEYHQKPFFCRAKGEAIRAFQTEANREGSEFKEHAGDFTLFEIGEFEEATGRIIGYEAKLSLGTALDYRREYAEDAPEASLAMLPGGKE